jgi:hypothetical protein
LYRITLARENERLEAERRAAEIFQVILHVLSSYILIVGMYLRETEMHIKLSLYHFERFH